MALDIQEHNIILNSNTPNHSHWKIHQVKQYPLTLSTNHTANVAQYTPTGTKIISWKGTQASRGGFSMVANSKGVEHGIERIVQQHFSDWFLGQSDVFERKNEETLGISIKTDCRKGEVEFLSESWDMVTMFLMECQLSSVVLYFCSRAICSKVVPARRESQ